MHEKWIDKKIGKKFGKLTLMEFIGINKRHNSIWRCECDCGNKNYITSFNRLKANKYVSCGCDKEEIKIEKYKSRRKENKYDLIGDYGIGYTSKNKKFYFDLEDYDLIKNYYWRKTNLGYVSTNKRKMIDGNEKEIMMHRLVLGLPEEYNYNDPIGEHINRIPYDNRKSNLQILPSNSENMFNKKKYKNNTSGCRGVNFHKNSNKWIARLWYKKENVFYQECDTIEEAIKLRKEAEIKYFGKLLTKDL